MTMIAVSLEKAVDFTSPEVLGGYVATALVALVGLLLTVIILKKILFKPLQKMMTDRQDEIDQAFERNESAAQAIQQRLEDLEAREARQKADLDDMRLQAEAEVQAREKEILQGAQDRAQALVAEADRQIQQKQKQMDDQIYRQAVDLAVSTMSQLQEAPLSELEADQVRLSISQDLSSHKEDNLES